MKKILIVEDDAILASTLADNLVHEGWGVVRAKNGEEGLLLVETERPDLVLLDIILPKVDGLTVAKKIRSHPLTKHLPIIILTNLEQAEPVATALESDVFEYIVKSGSSVTDIIAKIRVELSHVV